MANGVHKITAEFEKELCKYTGAPYTVALDNCSNALFLAIYYELNIKSNEYDLGDHYSIIWGKNSKYIHIPSRTYPSVPCEIIHAGGKVVFDKIKGSTITGAYPLKPTNVWDSALRFTSAMYIPGQHMCLSFTGPYKHLKLGKGGAILTDDKEAYKWFKRARFSGRREMSYHKDDLDCLGWNFYMMPEIAARGLLLITQFYEQDGTPKQNKDLTLPYPDLSKFLIYTK